MNGPFGELGKMFLEQERAKEEQKREQQLAKIRMQVLQEQARSYDDQQQGYQKATEEIDPVLRVQQENLNLAMADAAQSRQRATMAEYLALAQAAAPRAKGIADVETMKDVQSFSMNAIRMMVLEKLMQGEYPPEPVLKALYSGVEHPAERAREESMKFVTEERKNLRSTVSAYSKSWNSEMDALAKWRRNQEAEVGKLTPEQEELLKMQMFTLTSRYIDMIEDVGVPAPTPMYNMIGREPPEFKEPLPERVGKIPELPANYPGGVKRTRLANKGKGGKVYAGRSDITYGTEPGYEEQALTPEAESAILRDSYSSVIRDTFPAMSSAEIEDLADAMMAENAPKKKTTETVSMEQMRRQYPQYFGGGEQRYSAETEQLIKGLPKREKQRARRRKIQRASEMPLRMSADAIAAFMDFMKTHTPQAMMERGMEPYRPR